ncbi:MAG TPA: AbrB/MazE/SpoVT family DNA-binding domain-containing protein [Verrucomicrobiota bacterium]|nr:AbrB/MazE/SpoVT family DNA-binding domain-containing protein [Verrucomicrobiota bacterium]
MMTKLSSKGQVVLPKQARLRLRLRPGVKLLCEVHGGSILLTPEHPAAELPRPMRDPKSGLRITKSPAGTQVTSQDVRAALLDFP